MQLLTTWILGFILANAPLGRATYFPEAKEEIEAGRLRYESIANDVAEVVYDNEESSLYPGDTGKLQTVSLILSIMKHESAFRRDVDLGLGKYARGDGGSSWCSMQIRLGVNSKDYQKSAYNIVLDSNGSYHYDSSKTEGYDGQALITDRKKCIRSGLHIIRQSFKTCSSNPLDERLNAYASGSCRMGIKESKLRINYARSWIKDNPPTFLDKEIKLIP